MQNNINTLATSREVCLFNKLNPKKLCTNKCGGLYLRTDVIMFISFVSLSFREVVEQVVALISGHLQDPKNVCVTGPVRFQECFS